MQKKIQDAGKPGIIWTSKGGRLRNESSQGCLVCSI
jgi:hypothetical protein